MSQQMVRVVVHSLLNEEDLRVLFAIDPSLALADLNRRGVELTREEIEVLTRADARLWFWSRELLGDRQH